MLNKYGMVSSLFYLLLVGERRERATNIFIGIVFDNFEFPISTSYSSPFLSHKIQLLNDVGGKNSLGRYKYQLQHERMGISIKKT